MVVSDRDDADFIFARHIEAEQRGSHLLSRSRPGAVKLLSITVKHTRGDSRSKNDGKHMSQDVRKHVQPIRCGREIEQISCSQSKPLSL